MKKQRKKLDVKSIFAVEQISLVETELKISFNLQLYFLFFFIFISFISVFFWLFSFTTCLQNSTELTVFFYWNWLLPLKKLYYFDNREQRNEIEKFRLTTIDFYWQLFCYSQISDWNLPSLVFLIKFIIL